MPGLCGAANYVPMFSKVNDAAASRACSPLEELGNHEKNTAAIEEPTEAARRGRRRVSPQRIGVLRQHVLPDAFLQGQCRG